MVEGYTEAHKEENLIKWMQIRQICWMIYCANADLRKPGAAQTPQEFMPLKDEPKAPVKRVKKLSKTQQQKIADTIARLNTI